jgi:hypothetical protein
MGGLQSQTGRCGEEKILLHLPGIEPRFLGRLARNVVAIPTELSRVWNRAFFKNPSEYSTKTLSLICNTI